MNRKHIEIINKRQEELERRLDRSWRPKGGGRVLRGGNIVYDVSSRMGGVSSGGLGLIVQLVKRLRVAECAFRMLSHGARMSAIWRV